MSIDSIPQKLWISTFVITLSSFLFGYVFVCLNACFVTGSGNSSFDCFNGTDDGDVKCPKGSVYQDLELTVVETSLAVSLMLIGAWFGSAIGSYPTEAYGRRATLLYNSGVFMIGSALTGSGNAYCLYIGRFISGLGVGVVSVSAPMLLSEIAAADCRGIITTMHQVMVTVGIFVSSLVAFALVDNVEHGWQYVQYFQLIPAALTIMLYSFIPESPKWLIRYSREDEARNLLKQLRTNSYNIDSEVLTLQNELASQSEAVSTWSDVFANREAVVAGCGLMAFYSFTGINSVSFYSTTIFGLAGFSNSILGTVFVNATGLLATCFAAYLADRMDRKVLIQTGLLAMAISLAVLSSVLLSGSTVNAKVQGIVAVVSVLVYMFAFSVGMGSVVWVMMSEFTPNNLRSKAMSLYLNVNWASNVVIGMSTLPLIDALGWVHIGSDDFSDDGDINDRREKTGVALLYLIFLGFTVLCIAFVKFWVPVARDVDTHLTERLLTSKIDNHMSSPITSHLY